MVVLPSAVFLYPLSPLESFGAASLELLFPAFDDDEVGVEVDDDGDDEVFNAEEDFVFEPDLVLEDLGGDDLLLLIKK